MLKMDRPRATADKWGIGKCFGLRVCYCFGIGCVCS